MITDWQDIENLVTKYNVADTMQAAVALAVNAGIDMSMIPLDARHGLTTHPRRVRDEAAVAGRQHPDVADRPGGRRASSR